MIKIQNIFIRPSNAAKANIYISPPKCSFNLILTLRFKILNTDSLILILGRNNEKKPKLHVRHKNAILLSKHEPFCKTSHCISV